MQTPNTPEGALTEEIMGHVRRKLPNLEAHEYNAVWNSVFEVLTAKQPDPVPMTRDEFLSHHYRHG